MEFVLFRSVHTHYSVRLPYRGKQRGRESFSGSATVGSIVRQYVRDPKKTPDPLGDSKRVTELQLLQLLQLHLLLNSWHRL